MLPPVSYQLEKAAMFYYLKTGWNLSGSPFMGVTIEKVMTASVSRHQSSS